MKTACNINTYHVYLSQLCVLQCAVKILGRFRSGLGKVIVKDTRLSCFLSAALLCRGSHSQRTRGLSTYRFTGSNEYHKFLILISKIILLYEQNLRLLKRRVGANFKTD